MKNLVCPYMRNGTCYHSHCIYKPNYECNKPFMNKISNKNKKHVKTAKNKHYSIKKLIGERGNGKFITLRKDIIEL